MPNIIEIIKKQMKIIFGSGEAREGYKQQQHASKRYAKNMEHFKNLAQYDDCALTDSPIFILSAGWRTGSTLLQRLLGSSENTLLWGEPYDRSNIIQSLSDMLKPFSPTWPPRDFIATQSGVNNYSQKWIANLYPPEQELLKAHREFMNALFAAPAKRLGAKRWGIKEVRYGLKEIIYLQLLYPNAKFLYLKRDVNDAYTSYKKFRPAMNWYATWPESKIFTPFAFARHSARLTNEFETAQKLTGGIIINYSDLLNNQTLLDEIDNYCGVKCDRTVLDNKIDGTEGTLSANTHRSLSILENTLLKAGDEYGHFCARKTDVTKYAE